MGRISSQKRKNYIINGDMQISQRGNSFPAIASATYSLDRWVYAKSGAMVHTISQDTDVPTLAQSGYLFKNSLRLNLTTPDTSIAAGDNCVIQQYIEGYNFSNIAQKPITLSFWVKATLTGIYCINIRNSGDDRSYIAEYTINSSNTWEYKTIVISASPSAGNWNYTNGVGLKVSWTLSSGSTYQTTPGSWQTGVYLSTSNQVNGVNTGATDFRITGVMLNEGLNAQPFRTFGESFDAEIAACQRYYEKSYDLTTAVGTIITTGQELFRANSVNHYGLAVYKVSKRINTGTITFYNPVTGGTGTFRDLQANADRTVNQSDSGDRAVGYIITSSVDQNVMCGHWSVDAEL